MAEESKKTDKELQIELLEFKIADVTKKIEGITGSMMKQGRKRYSLRKHVAKWRAELEELRKDDKDAV